MKKMKKRVAVSCYEFQIVGLERSKRGLRGRPTVEGSVVRRSTRFPIPEAQYRIVIRKQTSRGGIPYAP